MAKKNITLDEIKAEHDAMDKNALREAGYMTIDEFIEKYTFGLKEHLKSAWSFAKMHELHHPEDLAVNASVYSDAVYQVIGIFGVAPVNKN